ncbi:MAG TPA: phosphotransferase family protein [Dehalococcoidia bacterium]|jgi:aminoglycoside phosphotransferase (APT) family kinase protein
MQALDELHARLIPFCRAQTGDSMAHVADVEVMPGHAGFSYGFTVEWGTVDGPRSEAFVLRLPPPNVRLEGTADVLRQARVLNAVRGSGVPVVDVRWSGDDPRWFGRPYFVVPRLPGDTLRTTPGEWGAVLPAAMLRFMAQQAVEALAGLHRLDWRRAIPEWAPPLEPEADVQRWDRFAERAADPELVRLWPELKRRLLERLPREPRMGIFHGDFQWSNLLYDTGDYRLLAVIDWELAGVGPVLNDLGWLMVFSDPESWCHAGRSTAPLPLPAELQAIYGEAFGADPGDVAWFRALAGYKFAIIGGFNLMLHRRGKRHDPHWEELAPSIPRLFERAIEVLDGAQ